VLFLIEVQPTMVFNTEWHAV